MPRYEFVVDGTLGREILSAFPELEPTVQFGKTVLSGTLAAPSAVREVLVRLESFGIGLHSMRVLEGDDQAPAPAVEPGGAQTIPGGTRPNGGNGSSR